MKIFVYPPFSNYKLFNTIIKNVNNSNTIFLRGPYTVFPQYGIFHKYMGNRYQENNIFTYNIGLQCALHKYNDGIFCINMLDTHNIMFATSMLENNRSASIMLNFDRKITNTIFWKHNFEIIRNNLETIIRPYQNFDREWCIINLQESYNYKIIDILHDIGFRQFCYSPKIHDNLDKTNKIVTELYKRYYYDIEIIIAPNIFNKTYSLFHNLQDYQVP